jgi:hypothetical protein
MSIGGLLSLSDRRMRLGIAERARKRRRPQATPVAAE